MCEVLSLHWGLSSGLLEEVFLEAFLNHRADAYVLNLILGDGVIVVVDNLNVDFIAGCNRFLEGCLGKGAGADKPQGHSKNGFLCFYRLFLCEGLGESHGEGAVSAYDAEGVATNLKPNSANFLSLV